MFFPANQTNYCPRLLIFLLFLVSSCVPSSLPASPTPEPPEVTPSAAIQLQLSATVAPSQPTAAPETASTGTDAAQNPTEYTESLGCQPPSSDYTRLQRNGHKLNQRTYDMLLYAQSLYNGQIDIVNAITQGSYTDAVEASFGTHAGGGAVDLSVMAPGTFTILYDEIEPLIHALRLAGFAAWFRDFDALYDGSPVHIHAIAIGDSELSLPAREQLAGPYGYFWGYDGLPREGDLPHRDPHGGPIVCDWMIEQGYPAKTATPNP